MHWQARLLLIRAACGTRDCKVRCQLNSNNRKLALYTEEFLTPSMTFIHRQLTSLPGDWSTFVLARTHKNEQLFPYQNVYISPRSIGDKLVNKVYRAIGYRFKSLGGESRKYFSSILEKEKPSLIHAHFGPSALEILPTARKLSIPMITTFHGFDASTLLLQKCYLEQLKELFSYSFVLTVSETMKNELIPFGASRERTRCAYIGVPVEKFTQVSRVPLVEKFHTNTPVQFLQVSNFVEKKGHQYTLEAFSGLLKYYPYAKLLLAGDGPLRQRMECYVVELGIQHAVEFLGHRDTNQVIELMALCDCFVHHSVTSSEGDKEGIPTVLMEAMASGLPVISTIHAGIPELIESEVDGYLVNEKDVVAYTSILRKVLEDDGTVGNNARMKVEAHFNMDKQIQLLAETYIEIINEKRINC